MLTSTLIGAHLPISVVATSTPSASTSPITDCAGIIVSSVENPLTEQALRVPHRDHMRHVMRTLRPCCNSHELSHTSTIQHTTSVQIDYSVSIGCRHQADAAQPHGGHKSMLHPLPDTGAYEVAMHSKLASTGNFWDAAKQKNKEMKRPQGLCSHGMPTRLAHQEEGAWIQGSLAAAARHAIRIARQIVRP
jgi:hypothetical protein